MNNNIYEKVYKNLYEILSDDKKDLADNVNTILYSLYSKSNSKYELESLLIDHINNLIRWKDIDKIGYNAQLYSFSKHKLEEGKALAIKSWKPLLRKAFYEVNTEPDNNQNKIAKIIYKIIKIYISHFIRFEIIIENYNLQDFYYSFIALKHISTNYEFYLTMMNMQDTLDSTNFYNLKKDKDFEITFEGIKFNDYTLKKIQKKSKILSQVLAENLFWIIFFRYEV